MTSLTRYAALLTLFLLSSNVFAGPTAERSPNTGAELTPIRFQLRWKHQFQFAGYYAAVEKGFYRQAGFDVTLVEGAPGRTPVGEVLAGRAQYAEANTGLLYHYLRGERLVALAAIFQHSPSVLIARRDSGIASPQDLVDRRVMMVGGTGDVEFLAMLRGEGIHPDQLEVQPSSYDINDLVDGKVDAFNAYLSNEPYFLKSQGIPASIINPRTYGVDFYSDILFTTVQEVREYPARAEAFRRATIKGWRYALDHPDEIIDLLLTRYGVQKNRDHLVYEADIVAKLVNPGDVKIGHMNPGRWERMAELFAEQGMTPKVFSLRDFLQPPLGTHTPEDANIITAAVLSDFAPLYLLDDDGQPYGFAIDILEHVVRETGHQLRYLIVDTIPEALEAVRSGRADLMPGFGLSPERRDKFLFSNPTEKVPISIFVRSDDASIKGVDGLSGRRVGVLRKSVAVAPVRKHRGTLVFFPDMEDALMGLLAHEVDAIVTSEPTMRKKARDVGLEERLKVVGKPPMTLTRGFLLTRSATELRNQLNPVIHAFVGTQEYMDAYYKWYGKPSSYWSVKRILAATNVLQALFLAVLISWHFISMRRLKRQLP